jgi:hypothetical protein
VPPLKNRAALGRPVSGPPKAAHAEVAAACRASRVLLKIGRACERRKNNSYARSPNREGAASTSRRHRKLLYEFRADVSGRGQPMRALKMAKSAPGGAVFGAIGLDRISELRERDLGGTHQTRSIVGLAAFWRKCGGPSFALGRRRYRGLMLLILRGRPD